jgi:hypothetical protein
VSPGAAALNIEGGISGGLRLNSLFSLHLEILMTGDTVVYRGLNLINGQYVLANEKFTNLSLAFPILCKINLNTGPFRISPLAGLYLAAPLGQSSYRYSIGGREASYAWSFSVPLGITAGLEGAAQYGPGRFYAGMRYAGDYGDVVIVIDRDLALKYRRHAFSLYLGYEFGFLDKKNIKDFLGELL